MCLTGICCRIISFFSFLLYLAGIAAAFASNYWAYFDTFGPARVHFGLWKECVDANDEDDCKKLTNNDGKMARFTYIYIGDSTKTSTWREFKWRGDNLIPLVKKSSANCRIVS